MAHHVGSAGHSVMMDGCKLQQNYLQLESMHSKRREHEVSAMLTCGAGLAARACGSGCAALACESCCATCTYLAACACSNARLCALEAVVVEV